MNTHASRFAFHRLWLKKNFMALLGLSSLQRPIIYIRAELVTVLRPLVLIQEFVLRPSQESCTKNWGLMKPYSNCCESEVGFVAMTVT
ncbi:hypothetical protein QFA96_12795 [Pseudomonas sp. Ap32]|nr:hypothetical protein QFA96_12795 [Pseudomonas sp. Ap32]